MIKGILFIFFCLVCFNLSAQHSLPPKGELFADKVVPSVYISIDQDSLDKLLDFENRNSNHHYPASFVFDNGVVRDTVAIVGFRLRGNTSRKAAKKSFKVSFNEFEKGQKYRGVEKLNINGEHNDPSITRAKICFDFLDYLEVPASRANHVKLFINGTYFGLYVNVEHYDEEFTQSRFNGEGNLYKCTYGADLRYRGASADNYKLSYYELKKPNAPRAYEDLAHFIDVLNNTPNDKLECELEQVFNVNSYLRCLVFDVLCGNWDGPNYNKNNFYLYYNTQSGLFEYIPYDLDNTLGVDFLGQEWSNRDIYSWSKLNSTRPLYQKVMSQQNYRDKFTYLMDEALSEYFNPDSLGSKINDIRTLIQYAAVADTVRAKDYEYTVSDFHNSFGYFSKDHVKYGLTDFINKRYNSAQIQLDSLIREKTFPMWHSAVLNENGDSVTFSIKIHSNQAIDEVLVRYNWDYQSAVWVDSMDLVDEALQVYSATIAWHPTLRLVSFNFEWLQDDIPAQFPSCYMFSLEKPQNELELYINEVMADNKTTIEDNNGEYDDWVELYYGGSSTISLKGYFLTDDISDPYKYSIPTSTMLPNSFKLIWADGEDEINHTNFKLSKAGETLAIFDSYGVLIDSVIFPNLDADVSWGRKNDGELPWVKFSKATPSKSNHKVVGVDEKNTQLQVYPNPSTGTYYIDSNIKFTDISVYDIRGVKMDFRLQENKLDIAALPSGLYVLTLSDSRAVLKTQLLKVN